MSPTEPLVKLADAEVIAHCEYLGRESRSSEIAGARGRAQIRAELRKAAADHGASHMRFSDYQDGSTQSEVARLYGCRDLGGSRSRLPRGALVIFADLLPKPSLSTNVTGTSQQFNGVTAYGLSANFDYFLSPHMSIGLAPRYTFGLQGEGATSSATQLDLLGRISFGTRAGDGASVRAYGTVGPSWILIPPGFTSSGVAYGLGGVVSLPVGEFSFFSVDIGYQFGGQTVSNGAQDIDAATNFFHVGIGVGSFL